MKPGMSFGLPDSYTEPEERKGLHQWPLFPGVHPGEIRYTTTWSNYNHGDCVFFDGVDYDLNCIP